MTPISHEFLQDKRGRSIKRTLPLGMFETMEYDLTGNLIRHTDFNRKTTTMVQDVMNRLVSKIPDPSLGEPSIHFTYTAKGQRASMRDATGLTTYDYDLRDRQNEKATPFGTLFYSRDTTGNITSIRSSNPNGVSVSYRWDDLNRLDNVHDDRLGAGFLGDTSHFYDGANNLTGYGHAARRMLFFHDSQNRLKEVQIDSLFGIANRFTYTLGPAGNRTAVTELNGRSVDYGYDDLYRLVQERISGDSVPANNGSISYVLDAVGNRLRRDSTVAPVPSSVSAYDANDRLASDSYDDNGNTIFSEGKTYTYNFENRIKSVNGGEVGLDYDGDGNLVGITSGGVTTNFLVDALNPTGYSQVMEELVNGQVVRTYTYGLDLLTQNQLVGGVWTPSFYAYDGQGSVRALFNSFGQVTDQYTYDAFGVQIHGIGPTGNNYRYAGEYLLGQLNLYNLRARYMNSASGRFLTTDPITLLADMSYGNHSYNYTNGNPIDEHDPSGLSIVSWVLQHPWYSLGIGIAALTATATVIEIEGRIIYNFEYGLWGAEPLNTGEAIAFRKAVALLKKEGLPEHMVYITGLSIDDVFSAPYLNNRYSAVTGKTGIITGHFYTYPNIYIGSEYLDLYRQPFIHACPHGGGIMGIGEIVWANTVTLAAIILHESIHYQQDVLIPDLGHNSNELRANGEEIRWLRSYQEKFPPDSFQYRQIEENDLFSAKGYRVTIGNDLVSELNSRSWWW